MSRALPSASHSAPSPADGMPRVVVRVLLVEAPDADMRRRRIAERLIAAVGRRARPGS